MNNFIRRYIDIKKLLTGLVQAVIIALFVLLWNHLEQLKNFLWPIFTFSLKVPVIPTLFILIITQYLIHKGLLKFQLKFGKKNNILIEKWTVKTNMTTPQWTEYNEIGLNAGLLTSVACDVEVKSSYLRFGFKLLDRNAQIIGPGGLLTNENNGLFHIGKAINDNKIYFTSYKNGVHDIGNLAGTFSNDHPIRLEIKIDNMNNLEFFVNNILCYRSSIKIDYRERLVLLAWGDGNEYEMIVSNIEVEINK